MTRLRPTLTCALCLAVLLWLPLLQLAEATESASGLVTIQRLLLRSPDQIDDLQFAIIRVPISISDNSTGSLLKDTGHFSTLRCGKYVVESIARPRRRRAGWIPGVPVHMLPLEEGSAGRKQPYQRIQTMLRSIVRPATQHERLFALFLRGIRRVGLEGADVEESTSPLFQHTREEGVQALSKCVIHTRTHDGQDVGSWSLRVGAAVLSVDEKVVASELAREAPKPPKSIKQPCKFNPAGKIFLSTEESNRLLGTARVGIFASLIDMAVTPVKDVLGQALGSSIGGVLQYWVGEVAKSGLSDDIANEINRALPPQIVQSVIPSLTETIPDQLATVFSRDLANFLVETVSAKTQIAMNKLLVEHLSKSIPQRVDIEAPKQLARKIASDLGQTTCRSISHAVVPALIQMLSHNHMQDTYCYYCYFKETYCEYCQYSPHQVYYAQYYTSYYSTYYGSYYNKYFGDREQLKMEQEIEREKEIVAEQDEYEEVLQT